MSYTNGLDNPELYFQTKLHSGTGGGGGSLTFDGSENMQADMVWSKSRTEALNHTLFDSVRGAGSNKELTPNSNSVEGGADSAGFGYISAFNSDGFTWTAGGTNTENFNKSSQTYAHWNWKAGTSFTNDASATSIGSIDSTGSFNNDSGFSIVSYTGGGSNATVKHGLNTAPSMIIFKRRVGTGWNWTTYHKSMGNNYFVSLNLTNAKSNTSSSTYFQDTTPTSSVFSIGDSGHLNGDAIIAYCFAPKQGFSKFGSYTGNGATDGAFVWTGQKSAFIMIKAASRVGTWNMYDVKRSTFNNIDDFITANTPDAETTGNTYQNIDILSNGFKCRGTGTGTNESGSTYIFMAFAENPFVTSTGVPATAR